MLHKCANPNCINPFRKLSEGKLFLVETESLANPVGRRWGEGIKHRIEHFWLCGQCASVLTLAFDKGKGLRTVPLPGSAGKKPVVSVPMAAPLADSA
jgi:hypothetical protein